MDRWMNGYLNRGGKNSSRGRRNRAALTTGKLMFLNHYRCEMPWGTYQIHGTTAPPFRDSDSVRLG